ncbi:MAG: GlmU family protein [Salinivirgaceae bacterium]|nr:GlmU family protein [Salinivirgaceae bacterium]MDD4746320.1 GlmU family protein [Salinivirgaceae bacterium]
MKSFILHDGQNHENLLPLTFTRGIGEIRVGILTIIEKWEKHLNCKGYQIVPKYLEEKYNPFPKEETLILRSGILPNKMLCDAIRTLKPAQQLVQNSQWIAAHTNAKNIRYNSCDFEDLEQIEYSGPISQIEFPWNIFMLNGQELSSDFELITKDQTSATLSPSNTVIGNGRIFIHPTATVEASTLNTTGGDIYIGEHAEIMEGCLIRAPFALGEHSTLKMGAKVYGATTIGKHSKVGGELNNVVIFGHSNKAHDGFLGNAVIGEWCNLGADTNNSNLKNNYAEVRTWNYPKQRFIKTGLQFCGLIMGDHSKCGINTMFNTGTVVGVSANIFGPGFPRNYIPSFSWGGALGFKEYKLEDALETARLVLDRRKLTLSETDKNILLHIYSTTQKYRHQL